MPNPATRKAESANYQSLALEVEKLRTHPNASMRRPRPSSRKPLPSMTEEKPNYWYVGYTDAPFDFFRGEEKITEEEWRREAPADEVAALDAEPRNAAKAELQTTSHSRWRSKSLVTLPNASMRRPRPSSRKPLPS